MLLSLVLCFDHRKVRERDNEGTFSRGNKYVQFGGVGYAVGMVAALAAGLLSQMAQPALLYLVRSLLPCWNLTLDHVVVCIQMVTIGNKFYIISECFARII